MTSLRARLIPVALLVAAASAWFAGRHLQVWTEDGPGPGLMPKVALALMGVLALAVALAPGARPAGEEERAGFGRTFAIYALGCAFMAGAAPFLGFVLPGIVTVLVILRFAEDRSWFASIAYAVALIGAIVLLFGTGLNVQFPDGPAERALESVGLI